MSTCSPSFWREREQGAFRELGAFREQGAFESESWELLEKDATVRMILGVLSLVSGV